MMRHFYKNQDGQVFEYESAQEAAIFGPDGLVVMTEVEVDAHLNPPPTPEQLTAIERAWRDGELARADIELNKVQDGMGTGTVSAWREYRCLLRNWPENEFFPDSTKRPAAPDAPVVLPVGE